jgi:carbonic anhydrase/acetyltransferase-like protein (isoleucine patch superfamily)
MVYCKSSCWVQKTWAFSVSNGSSNGVVKDRNCNPPGVPYREALKPILAIPKALESSRSFKGLGLLLAVRCKRERVVATHDFGDGLGPVLAHQHPNGGGWVADTASVEETVYVSTHAAVGGEAMVLGRAQIDGEAQVYDNARVQDYARVSGHAKVSGNAWICSFGRVYGNARIYGNASVSGVARIGGDAKCEKTPIFVSTPEFNLTITDNSIQVGDGTYTPDDKLPIPEIYREMVRGIFLERRENSRDPRSFWEKL